MRKKKLKPILQCQDRVRLMGRGKVGTLLDVNENGWARVRWDNDDGPLIVHLYELERIGERR